MTSEEIQELQLELGTLNKDFIMKFFYTPMTKFLVGNAVKYQDQLAKYRITDIKKIPTKDDMIGLVLKLYGDEQIARGFVASHNERDQTIIVRAVWEGGLDRAELERLFQRNVIPEIQERNYYSRISLIPDLKSWLDYIDVIEPANYYGNSELRLQHTDLALSFPITLRKLLAIHLPKPEGYFFQPIAEPGNHMKKYLTETVIFSEFARIIAYHGQGHLKYSQKGNPNQASAKKMSKALKIAELGPGYEFPVRSLLIAGLLGEDFMMKTITDSTDQIIRKLFATDFNKKQVAPFMLTHLKGLNYFFSNDYRPNTTKTILDVFRQLPKSEWISFENLQNFIGARFLAILPLKEWILRQKIQAEYETDGEEGIEKWITQLHAGNTQQFVWRPYLAGHVYLLAAFGLMDIAVDPTVQNQNSAYDNLHALRLTKLGAYVLGLSKDYTPPSQDANTSLSFDENSLIIRIEGDVALGDTLLANYATRVSENRYQFSHGKFLKECKSTKDIQNKITLFKQTIGQTLPPFWEDYLQELVDNSKSITPQSRIRVFTIPDQNKPLQRIMVQDDVLRKLVIKAEQYHILVAEINLSSFTNRLKELGYVLG